MVRHSRAVTVRLLTIDALKKLSSRTDNGRAHEFHPARRVLQQAEYLSPLNPSLTMQEMLEIFETEGSARNGGGMFLVKNSAANSAGHGSGGDLLVAFDPDMDSDSSGRVGSLSGSEVGASSGYTHKPGLIGTVPIGYKGILGSGSGGHGAFSGMSRSSSASASTIMLPSVAPGSRRKLYNSRPPWFY